MLLLLFWSILSTVVKVKKTPIWKEKLFFLWEYLNLWSNCLNGQFQKISIPKQGRLPCLKPSLPSEIPKCVTPPCPQNSIMMNPHPLQNFWVFLEVHFRLSNAYMNKRTWIYASSRLWSSGARRQALFFSDKKNLPLVARLCKLLFKSEFGYKNKLHLQ